MTWWVFLYIKYIIDFFNTWAAKDKFFLSLKINTFYFLNK